MTDIHVHELMTDEDFIQTIEEMHINQDGDLGDLLSGFDVFSQPPLFTTICWR